MSLWNHAVCPACWAERNPERLAVRVREDALKPCCYCTAPTDAGIYVRGDPREMPCRGTHDPDE